MESVPKLLQYQDNGEYWNKKDKARKNPGFNMIENFFHKRQLKISDGVFVVFRRLIISMK